MHILRRIVIAILLMSSSGLGFATEAKLNADVDEFIFEKAPFEQCHASTIVETSNGDLLAAWFGGQRRRGQECCHLAFSQAFGWSMVRTAWWWQDYSEVPCWNPVLFRDAKDVVWLFFKVGPDEESWVGAYRTSSDNGKNWGDITYLPAGLLGPSAISPSCSRTAISWQDRRRKQACDAATRTPSPTGVGRHGRRSAKMAGKTGRFMGRSPTPA